MAIQPKDKPETHFVKNPLSGKIVNVLPLFDLLTNTVNGSSEAAARLQEVHDFISTCAVKGLDDSMVNVEYLANMNQTLIMFREVFSRMQEVSC